MRMRRVAPFFDGSGRYIYQCPKCKSVEVTGNLVCYCQEPSCLEEHDGPPRERFIKEEALTQAEVVC